MCEAVAFAAASAQQAQHLAQQAQQQSNDVAHQFPLAVQALRQERPEVNAVVSGGGPPPPPPAPPGVVPLEMVPAAPAGRGMLTEDTATKRPPSRPADELRQRERRVQGRLAIAAAAGAASGPEQPEEVPSSSSAGPKYQTPERVQPLAAARQAVKPRQSRVQRRLEAAGFKVDIEAARRAMVGANAGVALGGDTSGSRPTVPTLGEAARQNAPFTGRPHRLTSDPPARRLREKTPARARARTRSRSVKA